MQNIRPIWALVFACVGACNATANTGTGGAVDAAVAADSVTPTDSVAADVVAPPADVPVTPTDVVTTPADVPVTPVDVVTIPFDLPTPPADVVSPAGRCGDGTCAGMENCGNCSGDCGFCPLTGPVTDACAAGAPQGIGRNCGWRAGVTLDCTAGRATMVGCTAGAGAGSLCQPSYGACAGDPVMRVCPGNQPCGAAMALVPAAGNFDDQCGTCPSGYVTCPASGQIHVLTGDYNSEVPAQRGTCTPVAR